MDKIKEIIIGTNNEGKYREICDLLPKEIKKYSPKAFKISNSLVEYFFTLFGNKLHISLYFPSLFVPIIISLILPILD